MDANATARVGLFLLGAYLIVSSLASAASLLSAQPIILGDASLSLGEVASHVLTGLFMVIVFGLVPGWLLIAKREDWADRWFTPSVQSSLALPLHSLYAIALVLLGVYFAISGGASFAGSVLYALVAMAGDEAVWSTYGITSLGHGFVQAIAGVVLWHVGRRLARNAA